eukprot:gene3056-biopygen2127
MSQSVRQVTFTPSLHAKPTCVHHLADGVQAGAANCSQAPAAGSRSPWRRRRRWRTVPCGSAADGAPPHGTDRRHVRLTGAGEGAELPPLIETKKKGPANRRAPAPRAGCSPHD